MENNFRVKGSSRDISVYVKGVSESGVLGWTTRQAVSSRTHPKMFEWFQTDPESFLFVPMVSLDVVVFLDSETVNHNILLPWVKCTLTNECIHPIGEFSIFSQYFFSLSVRVRLQVDEFHIGRFLVNRNFNEIGKIICWSRWV